MKRKQLLRNPQHVIEDVLIILLTVVTVAGVMYFLATNTGNWGA